MILAAVLEFILQLPVWLWSTLFSAIRSLFGL
jgi:hypothetical protein